MDKNCADCRVELTNSNRSGYCFKCRRRRNQEKWRHAFPEKDRENTYRYRQSHPEVAAAVRKQYNEQNKDKVRKHKTKYQKMRMETDIQFKLRQHLRTRLYQACKTKVGSAVDELGCSSEELKTYLESKFEPGMSWDNWGQGFSTWQIDHIEPLYKFNLENLEELKRATHFSNLRPYWHEDHIKKTAQENKDVKTKI